MAAPFPTNEMTIQRLAITDVAVLKDLLDVYSDAFEMPGFIPPPANHLASLLEDNKIIFLAAVYETKVIGGLTAYILPSVYYAGSEAYLYDLAVATAWQRQGIGTALLAALKEHCAHMGIREVFVQADRPDRHAIDFYTRNGGIPEDVIHFTYTIRPK